MEVFYLPSYSPELNPEERLNADLKQAMGKRAPVRTKAKLREAANEHMMQLKQSPERVRAYFQDPVVKYAAGASGDLAGLMIMWPVQGGVLDGFGCMSSNRTMRDS